MSTSAHQLAEFISNHQPLTVITGAGVSAASGIPTYRDDAGTWLRSDPIQHNEFIGNPSTRQRYWARSYSGWPYVSRAEPNETHRVLSDMEDAGFINLLVTQNVDRLHQRSGQKNVIDLHGRLDQVKCLECFFEISRDDIQTELHRLNPHLTSHTAEVRPDGDADVPDKHVERMILPDCPRCGGVIKPDVVFYGGGVEKQIVNQIYQQLEASNGLLVIGSSLMVFSSFRFCRFAARHEIPIGILNAGTTRADDLALLKIAEPCEKVLSSAFPLLKNQNG